MHPEFRHFSVKLVPLPPPSTAKFFTHALLKISQKRPADCLWNVPHLLVHLTVWGSSLSDRKEREGLLGGHTWHKRTTWKCWMKKQKPTIRWQFPVITDIKRAHIYKPARRKPFLICKEIALASLFAMFGWLSVVESECHQGAWWKKICKNLLFWVISRSFVLM